MKVSILNAILSSKTIYLQMFFLNFSIITSMGDSLEICICRNPTTQANKRGEDTQNAHAREKIKKKILDGDKGSDSAVRSMIKGCMNDGTIVTAIATMHALNALSHFPERAILPSPM